uniref:SPARC-like protein 1 n=1 Tax=Gouania willdenowi TaxID=441366 RepID=A0A8C5FYU5_GOUWI
NPVQIRATVDLYPRSRPSYDTGAHISENPDPCDNFRCKRGKTCKLNEKDKPSCVCQQATECPPSVNDFDHVCGTDNRTYDTSCELFATKCNLEGTKKGHRLHLDYTGSCKLIPQCVDTELVQFPLRMRDWLKNVLLQLYEHDSVTPGFLTPKQRFRVKKIFDSERRLQAGDHSVELLAQDFEKNYNMYIYPVHWQFAQLDQHPSDRYLAHSELAPLRVPLVPMEHCTSRFFQECDADKDKQVSFKEWTTCFGIKNDIVIFCPFLLVNKSLSFYLERNYTNQLQNNESLLNILLVSSCC